MSESLVEKIKQAFDDFDVVTFLEQHNVKYDEWLKSQIFQLLTAVEKEVLKITEDYTSIEKQKIQEFYAGLVQNEWRGISSELLEEFQDRFQDVFIESTKKETTTQEEDIESEKEFEKWEKEK